MTVIEAIRQRYSCRAYHEKPIEQEKLDSIFEAARLAPSAKNTQDWRFVVVTDKETKRLVADTTNRPDVFQKASAIIVACSNSDEVMRCGQAIGPIDVSIALEHIALQATELGLATCWIGSFLTDKVRAILNIPSDVAIIELMTIGYPADSKKEPQREPI
ncbi:MAG: nitroreductase, partial [Phycisphaerae bacterium]|nr:nitroreductase [Phycisphaerae bacterium]NIU55828.1 nitroreductase [Phycisphaerae bacterium]